MDEPAVILGIDPGLATIGYAVLEMQGEDARIRDYGIMTTQPNQAFHERLQQIQEDLTSLVQRHHPKLVFVEELFFGTNAKTAIQVAQARGVIIATVASCNLVPQSITPNQVKLGLTGEGTADKRQVQEMLKLQFKLSDLPSPDDAADAIAIAYCGMLRHRHPAA